MQPWPSIQYSQHSVLIYHTQYTLFQISGRLSFRFIFCLNVKINLTYRCSGVLTSMCTWSSILSIFFGLAKCAVQHLGERIIRFQHCHLISSQMLKNSVKIFVLYPGFHFLVENHIKLSFLWNMENSTCRTRVMLLRKREIPDTVYRDRQLVCSALARPGQPTFK